MNATDLALSVECPVCLEVFRQPKCLPCGHSFCEPCRLGAVNPADGRRAVCPVCRVEGDVPPAGLATNYALAVVLEQINSAAAEAKYKCVECAANFAANDAYVCGAVNCAHRVCCAPCAIAAHNGHQLTKLSIAMQQHNDEKAAWQSTNTDKLVGSEQRVEEREREMVPRLRRLADLVVRCGMDLVKNGETILAAANGVWPTEPTPTDAFPPFAICTADLQQRMDAHAGRVQQFLDETEQFSRPMIALEAALARILPAPLLVPPRPPPNLVNLLNARLRAQQAFNDRLTTELRQEVADRLATVRQEVADRPVPPPVKRARR